MPVETLPPSHPAPRTPATVQNAPNSFCPHDPDGYQDNNCTSLHCCWLGNLEAYYVTAQGPDVDAVTRSGESPRSNIYFYDAGISGQPGGVNDEYVFTPAAPEESAPEILIASEGDSEQFVCRWDPSSGIGQGPTGPSLDLSPVLRAPMRTLGDIETNPPWILQDLHTDHLGSVRLVTSNDGSIASRHDYFPFGETVPPAFATYNTHAFTGHERDSSGLDYMMARYYMPSIARFVAPDDRTAAVAGQQWNLYTYAFNNPLSHFDPSGHWPKATSWENKSVWVAIPPDVPGGAQGTGLVDIVLRSIKNVIDWGSQNAAQPAEQAGANTGDAVRKAIIDRLESFSELGDEGIGESAGYYGSTWHAMQQGSMSGTFSTFAIYNPSDTLHNLPSGQYWHYKGDDGREWIFYFDKGKGYVLWHSKDSPLQPPVCPTCEPSSKEQASIEKVLKRMRSGNGRGSVDLYGNGSSSAPVKSITLMIGGLRLGW